LRKIPAAARMLAITPNQPRASGTAPLVTNKIAYIRWPNTKKINPILKADCYVERSIRPIDSNESAFIPIAEAFSVLKNASEGNHF